MSAAVWCADLGLRPVLIERSERLGGQLLWTHNPITNYLGVAVRKGAEMASKFADQVGRSEIEIITGREVDSVDLSQRSVVIGDEAMTGDAVVIATGVHRRKLGIPGEDEFIGRGVLVS